MWTEKQLRDGIDDLSLDELVGQVLCYEIHSYSAEEYEEIAKKTMPGGVFYNSVKTERRKEIDEVQKKYCRIPTIYAADVEEGPANLFGGLRLPNVMACSAANDTELIEKLYHLTAQAYRKEDISLALAPVVDINYNFQNSVLNARAASDDPDQVIKIGTAMVKGFQQDNLMAACCKHFPGDGMDDRNQHFMTTINPMSREEWMNTYGRVYREMIKAGTMAIMVAHIALPAFDEKIDDIMGYPPATLSKNLMTGLLKGELGYDGCIVSDAMCMIGACAMAPAERLAVEYLKAGGDMVLFPLPTDFDYIKAAVESGEITMERIKDAVLRIWRLKNSLGLFDKNDAPTEEMLTPPYDIEELAQNLTDKSLTVIRDVEGIIENTALKPGDKVLHVVSVPVNRFVKEKEYPALTEELQKHGVEVTTMVNPGHNQLNKILKEYDAVLLTSCYHALNNNGGSNRIGWDQAMTMWRAYILQHPRLIFASLGDPYKLYDYPYLKTYINGYSHCPATQRALAKLLVGEIKAEGKSPVAFEGFFEREV